MVEPLRAAIKPVIFETGIESAPYTTVGTCFLVKLKCGIFAVTLKHVVREEKAKNILILRTRKGMVPVRFTVRINVDCADAEDSEVEDLVLLAVDPKSLSLVPSNNVPCYEIDKITDNWEDAPDEYNYMVFGYPSVERDIDYENRDIVCPQQSFSCRFAGNSMLDACYKLNINPDSNSGSSNIDGYSGSPVFAWHKDAKRVREAVFCGVAIQSAGTTLNFLRRGVIDEVAKKLCS